MSNVICTNLRVTKNAIAVQLAESPTQKSGIFLPERRVTRDSILVEAVVRYVGEDYEHKDEVKIGDKVIVSSNLGAICSINGEELRIYLSEDVLAKIE